jgi:hypothetical protein
LGLFDNPSQREDRKSLEEKMEEERAWAKEFTRKTRKSTTYAQAYLLTLYELAGQDGARLELSFQGRVCWVGNSDLSQEGGAFQEAEAWDGPLVRLLFPQRRELPISTTLLRAQETYSAPVRRTFD